MYKNVKLFFLATLFLTFTSVLGQGKKIEFIRFINESLSRDTLTSKYYLNESKGQILCLKRVDYEFLNFDSTLNSRYKILFFETKEAMSAYLKCSSHSVFLYANYSIYYNVNEFSLRVSLALIDKKNFFTNNGKFLVSGSWDNVFPLNQRLFESFSKRKE